MRFAPPPTLFLISFLQIALATVLGVLVLRASITHQRAAELYSEKARLSEKTVPVSALRLQTEAVASSDRSLTACLFLSVAVIVLAFVQLWLIMDFKKAGVSETDADVR
jgi:hypothetical protein